MLKELPQNQSTSCPWLGLYAFLSEINKLAWSLSH